MKLEQITLPIKEDLERVEEVISERLKSDVPFITTVTHYITENGGKRVRPAILLLAARMAGYSGPSAIECAAAIEFCHTATLLHDDVVDAADVRRGQSTANISVVDLTQSLADITRQREDLERQVAGARQELSSLTDESEAIDV